MSGERACYRSRVYTFESSLVPLFMGGALVLIAIYGIWRERRPRVGAFLGLVGVAFIVAYFFDNYGLVIHPKSIDVVYPWPRPPRTIALDQIKRVIIEESWDRRGPYDTLIIRTRSGESITFRSRELSKMEEAERAIRRPPG